MAAALLATVTCLSARPIAYDAVNEAATAYAYSREQAASAASNDLAHELAALARAGSLEPAGAEADRVRRVYRRLMASANLHAGAGGQQWALHLHAGPAHAYARAGGQIVISMRYVEHYRLTDDELGFVLAHEIAHVLCEHERARLSAVWRRNAPHKLAARHAIEYLDTEPWVRAQIAELAALQEREADRIGLALAARAGFDPAASLRFFTKAAHLDGNDRLLASFHDEAGARGGALRSRALWMRITPALLWPRALSCGLPAIRLAV